MSTLPILELDSNSRLYSHEPIETLNTPILIDGNGNITISPRLDFENIDGEFYLRSVHSVRKTDLKYPNILPQMRSRVTEGQKSNLKNSLKEHGLVNEPYYALMTPAGTQEYLNIINERWETKVSTDDMKPLPSGDFLIVVAGHSRTISSQELSNEGEYSKGKFVDAKIMLHPNPYDILMMQLAENVFEAPSPERYAEIIQEIYFTGSAAGIYASVADFVRKSPLGEDKVRSALKFMELPESIQSAVREANNKHCLRYGQAIRLHKLMKPYAAYLDANAHLIEEGLTIPLIVERRLISIAVQSVGERWSNKKIDDVVKGLVFTIEQELADDIHQLFEQSQNETYLDAHNQDLARIKAGIAEASGSIAVATTVLRMIPNFAKSLSQEQLIGIGEQLGALIMAATFTLDQVNAQIVNTP